MQARRARERLVQRTVAVLEAIEQRPAVEQSGLAAGRRGAPAHHDLKPGRRTEEVLAVGVKRREPRTPGERVGGGDGPDRLPFHHLGPRADELVDEHPRLIRIAANRWNDCVAVLAEMLGQIDHRKRTPPVVQVISASINSRGIGNSSASGVPRGTSMLPGESWNTAGVAWKPSVWTTPRSTS